MMKQQIGSLFSGKLYRETLRRLRVSGIVMAVGCLLASAFISISMAESTTWVWVGSLDDRAELARVLMPFSVLGTWWLMFQAFGYLYRREASDLYHSLPTSRLGLCLTQMAAVLTWVVGIVALVLAVNGLLMLVLGAAFPWVLLPKMLLFHTVSALLTAAAALIGLSVSGTQPVGVVVTLAVLFLPRLALMVFRESLVGFAEVMLRPDAPAFLSPALHLPSAALVSLIQWHEMNGFLGHTLAGLYGYNAGIAYSLGLAILLGAVGGWLFRRRPSERAEQRLTRSAPRYVLHGGCILAGLLAQFLLMFTSWDFQYWFHNWVTLPVLYGLAVALYLAWEGLRGKSWRRVGGAAAAAIGAAAVVAGLVWTANLAGQAAQKVHPSTDEIASVRLYGEPSPIQFMNDAGGESWNGYQTQGVRFTDEPMRDLAARAVAFALQVPDDDRQTSMELTLTDGRKLRRTVAMPGARWDALNGLLENDEAFMAALRTEPERPLLWVTPLNQSSGLFTYGTMQVATQETAQSVYEALQQDLSVMENGDYLRTADAIGAFEDEAVLRTVAWVDGRQLARRFNLNRRTTPQAIAAHARAVNAANGETYQALLPDWLEHKGFGYRVQLFEPQAEGVPHRQELSKSEWYWDDGLYRQLSSQERWERLAAQDTLVQDVLSRAALADTVNEHTIVTVIQLLDVNLRPGVEPIDRTAKEYVYEAAVYLNISPEDWAALLDFVKQNEALAGEES